MHFTNNISFSVIDFLLQRLQRGQIYTWVGSLLLTLNPNNEVSTSHLYNSSEFNKHIDISHTTYEANPHIFAVAAKAHYNLIKEHGRNAQVEHLEEIDHHKRH